VAVDHLDDIDPRQQRLDEVGRDHRLGGRQAQQPGSPDERDGAKNCRNNLIIGTIPGAKG
jgi:hypothetical protein